MRVLIANKFYYPRGGDCIVAMATRRLLADAGHQVRVFAMDYPDNLRIDEEKSFARRVDFSDSAAGKLRAVARVFGYAGVRRAFGRALDEFRPDVVHLHNIHSYLSPALAEEAARRGIRTVWTMHDYKLICPAYSCRRPGGEICQDCIGGSKNGVVRNRCMKGSLLQSVIARAEAGFWNRPRLERCTSLFIAPSRFLAGKMEQDGFSPSKITTICNFIDPAKMDVLRSADPDARREGFCYVGRLSEEKGVETMLRAAAKSGVRLRVAGGGPLADKLRARYGGKDNIEFLGHLDASGVATLLTSSQASVIPSECYENNPLGAIESLCAGTPVIGAEIGGIPELIGPADGLTFPSGDSDALAAILSSFSSRVPFDNDDIARRARKAFSAQTHLDLLLKAYATPGKKP